jgi:uncharacterized protein (DUF58 family)
MSAVPRPRKRAAGLVVGAAILFAVGTNVQAGWLSVLAAILLGATAGGWLLPMRMVRGIGVELRAPAWVQQGDRVTVSSILSNPGRGLRLGLEVDDGFLEPTASWAGNLMPGRSIEVSTVRTARLRGRNAEATVTLRSSAPFGVASVRRRVRPAIDTTVYPRVEELGALTFVDATSTSERAIHAWPRRGTGPEYLGIREYRQGDSMRHVHWPSTARHGTVMVREFEAERTRRLAIVVDAARDAGRDDGEGWTPLDACCCAAASMAMAALAAGRGARLVIAPGDETEVLARADDRALLERLADLQPAGAPRFGEVVASLEGELRGIDTVVLAFPTWRENAASLLAPAVVGLTRQVPRVVAVAVEGQEMTPRGSGTLDGSGVDELEAALVAGGVEVHRWRAGSEPLLACLERSGSVLP